MKSSLCIVLAWSGGVYCAGVKVLSVKKETTEKKNEEQREIENATWPLWIAGQSC